MVRTHVLLATHMLQSIGVVPPQEVVLLYLDDHGPCPQQEIVRFMGRDRSTVTNALQAMERKGLIPQRTAEANRRASVVDLTETRKSLVQGVRQTWAGIVRQAVAGLSEAQLAHLFDGLTR